MMWTRADKEEPRSQDVAGDIEKGYGTTAKASRRSEWKRRHDSSHSPSPLGPRWMSLLSDDMPMSALTLPGTHDSAAFKRSWPFVQTQQMDISAQLQAGIRYFDLRCGIRNDVVEMVHGPTYLGITLDTILEAMYVWLASHPREAIIIQLKRDRKEQRSTVQFPHAVASLLSRASEFWRTANTMPSLGELRGRIQLFRRFGGINAYGINVTEWQDNSVRPFTIYARHNVQVTIQDHYSFTDPETLPSLITKKGGDVSEMLNLASTDDNPEHWYINFTTAYEFNLYYQLTPREVAVGGWWAFRWREGINIRLREYLRECEGTPMRFGVVAMDFPELGTDGLVDALIRTNFTRDQCARHLRPMTLLSVLPLILLLAILWTFWDGVRLPHDGR